MLYGDSNCLDDSHRQKGEGWGCGHKAAWASDQCTNPSFPLVCAKALVRCWKIQGLPLCARCARGSPPWLWLCGTFARCLNLDTWSKPSQTVCTGCTALPAVPLSSCGRRLDCRVSVERLSAWLCPPPRPPLESVRPGHCCVGCPSQVGPTLPGGPALGSPPRLGNLAVVSRP